MAGWYLDWDFDGLQYNPTVAQEAFSDMARAVRERQVAAGRTPHVYDYPSNDNPTPSDFDGMLHESISVIDIDTFYDELVAAMTDALVGSKYFWVAPLYTNAITTFTELVAASDATESSWPSTVRTSLASFQWFKDVILGLKWLEASTEIVISDHETANSTQKYSEFIGHPSASTAQDLAWIAYLAATPIASSFNGCEIRHRTIHPGLFQSMYELHKGNTYVVDYSILLPTGFILRVGTTTFQITKTENFPETTYLEAPDILVWVKQNGLAIYTDKLEDWGIYIGGESTTHPTVTFTPESSGDTFLFDVDGGQAKWRTDGGGSDGLKFIPHATNFKYTVEYVSPNPGFTYT